MIWRKLFLDFIKVIVYCLGLDNVKREWGNNIIILLWEEMLFFFLLSCWVDGILMIVNIWNVYILVIY